MANEGGKREGSIVIALPNCGYPNFVIKFEFLHILWVLVQWVIILVQYFPDPKR